MRHVRRREGATAQFTREVSGGAAWQFSPSASEAPSAPPATLATGFSSGEAEARWGLANMVHFLSAEGWKSSEGTGSWTL